MHTGKHWVMLRFLSKLDDYVTSFTGFLYCEVDLALIGMWILDDFEINENVGMAFMDFSDLRVGFEGWFWLDSVLCL